MGVEGFLSRFQVMHRFAFRNKVTFGFFNSFQSRRCWLSRACLGTSSWFGMAKDIDPKCQDESSIHSRVVSQCDVKTLFFR